MGKGSTTTQSGTSTQVNQIPQWISDAGQQNYAYAQGIAQQPLQQYQGQMVADTAPQTQQAWNVASNSGNVGSDQYNAATAGYLNAMGQVPMMNTAAQTNASQLANTNLAPYMNPYTQDVINATLPLMQQQNALSQNQQANAANSSNAFGGSRQGIQQGVAQAQGALNIGQMAAQLNQANFAQAQQAGEFDVGQKNTVGMANTSQANTVAAGNQAAQQAAINSGIQASQGLTNTGDSMNKANAANYNLLQSAGAGQSMQAQNQINAQMAKFNQAFNYPQQQLGTLEASLGMTPHDTSSSGQTTQQTTTPTDWASLISNGAQAAGSIFAMSDKTMKKDIEPTGESVAGVPNYTYRFKGDSSSSPKIKGPMAQDIQKVAPDAVKRVGGKLAVSAPVLGALTAKQDTRPPIPLGGQHIMLPRGYAAGTPFVGQPSLAAFTPPSSPGVAKGIGAMSAFRPPVRLPRGATMPRMPKGFAFGTSDVPDMDDAAAGDEMMGGDGSFSAGGNNVSGGLSKISKLFGGGDKGKSSPPQMQQAQGGWNAPSMGYSVSGFARGASRVPGPTDTVPAMLTPGEAVLTPRAAAHIGRPNIARLNALMPPVGMRGALSNTKMRPRVMGGLVG